MLHFFSFIWNLCANFTFQHDRTREKMVFKTTDVNETKSHYKKNDYNVLAKRIVVIFASAIQFCNYQTTRIHSHFEMQLIELKYFFFYNFLHKLSNYAVCSTLFFCMKQFFYMHFFNFQLSLQHSILYHVLFLNIILLHDDYIVLANCNLKKTTNF